MLGLGDDWGQQERMRESLIHHRCTVPAMNLLVKDHKVIGDDGLPATRPVVGACKGMNVPLSYILSEVLEPVASCLANRLEVVSREHMLNRPPTQC